MKFSRVLATTVFATLLTTAAHAQVFKHPTLLKFKVMQNGEVLAAPNLMVEQRIPAVFEIDGVVRLEVMAVSNEEAADMQLKLSVLRDGSFVQVATPRLLGLFNEQAAVDLGAEAGRGIRIAVVPSKGERNETPKENEK